MGWQRYDRGGAASFDEMNPRTFLQRFEDSADRDRLVGVVYDEMAAFCKEEGILTDEVSSSALEELAEGVVTRGLSVESGSALETEFSYLTQEELDALDQME